MIDDFTFACDVRRGSWWSAWFWWFFDVVQTWFLAAMFGLTVGSLIASCL